MYNSQEIANRIKIVSKQQGKSLSDVLTSCNLGINTIAKINKGGDILTLNFAKIADYLGCSVDYLLGRDNIPGISHVSNAVVMHTTNSGDHVSIANNAASQKNEISEQELELLRAFRTLDMRKKHSALTFVYELEDQMSKNQE